MWGGGVIGGVIRGDLRMRFGERIKIIMGVMKRMCMRLGIIRRRILGGKIGFGGI